MPGRRDGRRGCAALPRLRSAWWGPALALVVLVSGTVSELRAAPPASGSTVGSTVGSSTVGSSTVGSTVAAARRPATPPRARPAVGLRSRAGWAGTWMVHGRPAFGIDLDSRDPATATGYTTTVARSVRRQVGWSKDHHAGGVSGVKGATLSSQDLARLGFLTDRYAAAKSATTAAAAEHAVLTITAVDRAQKAREKARWATVVTANRAAKAAYDAVAADVRDHCGPYSLTTAWTTAPSAFTPGVLAVQLVSAAGKPMAGVHISGRSTSTPGAASVTMTTDAKGGTKLKVPVRASGALAVTLTAADLPGAAPLLSTPKRFRDRRSPDHLAARLVGAAPRTSIRATATASVPAAVPIVGTRANPAAPAVSSHLTDDVALTGTVPGYRGRISASLWGPFPASPSTGDCNALTAKLAARVTVDASGDGTVTTPAVTVVSPGYYTWTEDVPGTPLQQEVLTTCGDLAETFVVPGAPLLSLAVTGDRVPGGDLEAGLTIRGSFPRLAADATLTLYGPFASVPTASSCTANAVADTTTTTVQDDGTVVAATVTAALTGYYTWTVTLPSVGKTQASASIACGDPQGVFAVTRPDIGPLDLTSTGSVGATDPSAAAPTGAALAIGSVSISAPLVGVPLNPPGIAVPSDYSLAGEVDVGAHVGDAWGTIVVAGRVGDVHGVHGALYDLSRVAAGDTITLTDADGLTARFTVSSVATRPRTDVLPASLFTQSGPLRLVILSATDPVFFGGGLITYRSHVIVTATAG